MIEVEITRTGKPKGNTEERYSTFDTDLKCFDDVEEARAWIDEEYGNHKREKMYCDDSEGNAKHVGWIFGFSNKDISHDSPEWWQQDWVSVWDVRRERIVL